MTLRPPNTDTGDSNRIEYVNRLLDSDTIGQEHNGGLRAVSFVWSIRLGGPTMTFVGAIQTAVCGMSDK
jgi:hypothetical protein